MGSKQHLPPGLPPTIMAQAAIRENATEVQNYLSELSNWSKEMRATELAASATPLGGEETAETNLPPLRNDPTATKHNKKNHNNKNKKANTNKVEGDVKKIPGGDYSAWEKFDAEKACEEVEDKKPKLSPSLSEEEAVKRRAIEIRLQKMANDKKDLGNQCLKEKEYDKAVEHYTEGIRCDKKSAVLYANRAQAHIFLKQYNKAIEDCSSSITNDATYIKAYFRRAKARFSLGKLVDAKQDLEHTLKLEPGNVEAKQLLNEISRKTMQSLFSTTPAPPLSSAISKSAPATPSSQQGGGGERLSHFPGALTQLLTGGSTLPRSGSGTGIGGGGGRHPFLRPYSNPNNYDDDEDLDLGGGGDNETYPKTIIPIIKPPARRSKRPLLPIHVKVIGKTTKPVMEDAGGEDKKMRLNLDCNGNEGGVGGGADPLVISPETPSSPNLSSSSSCSSAATASATTTTLSSSIPSTPTLLPSLFSQLQMTSLPPKPNTAAQFGLDWRKLKGNSELCAQYLAQLKEEDYKMFGESLEYGRLSEILDLLVWEFLPRGWPLLPHLEGLSSVRRFSTLALFMSERDRANARKLISEVHPASQDKLSSKYALI